MTAAGRPASDAHLFLLDHSGVFFSESRQELHTFNTAAAYIWCCLDEGLSSDQIVAAFAEDFACPTTEAQGHVSELLHRWYGLGFIDGLDEPPLRQIDLTTALGRLLSNPKLRDRFAHAPADTARGLGLRAEDRAAFVDLDAKALDRQARTLRAKKLSRRRLSRTAPAGLADWLRDEASSAQRPARAWAAERWYRLVTTCFRLRFESPGQEAAVGSAIGHLEVAPEEMPDATIEVIEHGDAQLLFRGGDPVARCQGLDRLAPAVTSLLRQIAVNRQDYVLALHAGAVTYGDGCLLLPAAPGGGKTSLTAALIRSGFDYLTDELSLIEAETHGLRPVPISLTIKPGSVDLLAPFVPDLPALRTHVREDEQVVRYLLPWDSAPPARQHQTYQVKWIIFPRLAPDAPARLKPLPRIEALDRLLGEALVLPEDLTPADVAGLVAWMQRIESYELPVGRLDDAVGATKALCEKGSVTLTD